MYSEYSTVYDSIKNYLKNLSENFSYTDINPDVYIDIIPKNVIPAISIEHINEKAISFVDIVGTKHLSFLFSIVFTEEYLESSSKINYLESLAKHIKDNFDKGLRPDVPDGIEHKSIEKIDSAYIEEKNDKSVIYKVKLQFNYLEVINGH